LGNGPLAGPQSGLPSDLELQLLRLVLSRATNGGAEKSAGGSLGALLGSLGAGNGELKNLHADIEDLNKKIDEEITKLWDEVSKRDQQQKERMVKLYLQADEITKTLDLNKPADMQKAIDDLKKKIRTIEENPGIKKLLEQKEP
jgi:hypothetical protein